MTHLIKIGNLFFDVKKGSFFSFKKEEVLYGYVGYEIETGNIRFLTYYDQSGIYRKDKLFDINKEHPLFKYVQKHMDCVSPISYSYYGDNMEKLVNYLLFMHHRFNKDNNYPINYMSENLKTLSFLYQNNKGKNAYNPTTNIIFIDSKDGNFASISNYEYLVDCILHELGHLKKRHFEISDDDKEIKIYSGLRSAYTFKPFMECLSKDIFYDEINGYDEDKLEVILDEMINEYELSLIYPEYLFVYPSYGQIIDKLCGGKLIEASYNGEIDTYYESMERLINSESLAKELLEYIYAYNKYLKTSFVECFAFKEKQEIDKIIKEYSNAARKIN